MIKIGYLRECNKVSIPREVKSSLQNYLQILDENYGEERDIVKDLGGYAIIVESNEDIEKIDKEILRGVIPEDIESIQCGAEHWMLSLYIVSSDYCVILAGPKEVMDILPVE